MDERVRKLFLISIVSLLVIIISIGTVIKLNNIYLFTVNSHEVFINIDNGSSLATISKVLKKEGVINSPKYFIFYTKLIGLEKNIQAGKYVIPIRIKLGELLEKLQNPQRDYVKVTIPEGFSLYQIAEKLEKNHLIDKEIFMKSSDEGLNELKSNSDLFYRLEGYLFPDTYYIPKDLSEKEIIEMMINQLNEKFSDEYEKRAKELGLSLHEALTIASLIEKEAANDKERKTISGVIYNRLENGMPLQIDASVIYGITKGERHIKRVMYSDLESESKYNTYKYKGIPPGPIASPGLKSIEAALYPEKQDYLYYVLGKEGHIFSKTYKEHRRNIKKYIK